MGIGYIIGDKSNKADFITGKETIPVEALTENGIDEKQIHECLIQRFERPRKTKKKIYSSYLIFSLNQKKETMIGFFYLYYYFFNFVKMNKSKVPTTVDIVIVTK